MTVPGKGGRPRKWRSDADRVRAYRARQQGVEEPRVLSIALDDGDDLALAWDTIRQLQTQLAGESEVRQRLQKELKVARRQLDQQQARFGWIEKARTVLQGERDALVAERGELRAELNTLCGRTDAADKSPAAITSEPSATTAQPRSRAERRHGSSVKNSAASGSIDRCVPVPDVRFPLAQLQRVNRGEDSC